MNRNDRNRKRKYREADNLISMLQNIRNLKSNADQEKEEEKQQEENIESDSDFEVGGGGVEYDGEGVQNIHDQDEEMEDNQDLEEQEDLEQVEEPLFEAIDEMIQDEIDPNDARFGVF